MNKDRLWLLGGLFGGWLSGFVMMLALLSSEGKLSRPQAQDELWGGAGIFGAVCVLVAAALCVMMSREHTRQSSLVPFLIFAATLLPVGTAIALSVKLISLTGLLSKGAIAAWMPLLAFLWAAAWLWLAKDRILLALAGLR